MGRFQLEDDDMYSSDEPNCFTEIDGSTLIDDSRPEYDAAYETNLTEYSDDEGDDGNNNDEDDLAQLLADNEHPPEYYIRQIKEFNEVKDTEENYSDGTIRLLDRLEEQWYLFCEYIKKTPQKMYRSISLPVMRSFFSWILNRKRGKEGRRMKGIKYRSTLGTYWKVFRLVYERRTANKINQRMNRGMHRVLRKLAKKHGLKDKGKEKPCMYVEDQKEVLRTNLTTTEKRYSLGRIRMQIQLYLQLAGFFASRPQALLNLCYRHIIVTLLRDPEGGPHRVLLEFTFEFTKTFLGAKDINTFPVPEIIYDPSLIFSPHVILQGLLFDDNAFAAPSLTSSERFSELYIEPGKNQLPIPLDSELDNVPVFRQPIKTLYGWRISEKEPMSYSLLYPTMKKLGQLTNFLHIARPYALRYGAGKAFNENGNVSETLQNLMMGHGDIRTFLKHYMDRRVSADTAAIVRGLDPQTAIMRAARTMSRWIDPDRPWGLTAEQAASVNTHNVIKSLYAHRDKLKKRLNGKATLHPEYKDLMSLIRSEKQRLRSQLLTDIQEKYEREEPVRIIEQQLSGVKITKEAKVMSYFSEDTLPEQRRLIETIMLAPPGTTYEEEVQRRNNAINAVAAYCKIEEGQTPKRGKSSNRVAIKREDETKSPQEIALEEAMLSVYQDHRPKRCFVCLGNENLPFEKRVYEFGSPSDLSKHFKRKHLSKCDMQPDLRPECKLCKMLLEHKMHLQRHALEIHGTVS